MNRRIERFQGVIFAVTPVILPVLLFWMYCLVDYRLKQTGNPFELPFEALYGICTGIGVLLLSCWRLKIWVLLVVVPLYCFVSWWLLCFVGLFMAGALYGQYL